MRLYTASVLCVLVALSATAAAADWGAFRGPSGNGISTEKNVPTSWDAKNNVKWKVPLPTAGNGSPIVVAGKVFVNCAEDADGKQRTLFCINRMTGEVLWKRTVEHDKKEPTHQANHYCGSTPVSDGERVITWHDTAGLYCYDLDGKELWSRDLGEFEHQWGFGSSPVIYKDRILLSCGPGKRIFVTAIDLASGKTLWEQEEPQDSEKPDARADNKYKGSWATPVVANIDGKDQVIVTLPTRVVSYDPLSGEIIWSCEGIRGPKGDLAYSSPLIGDGLLVATGGFGGPSIGVKLGGKGDVTDSHQLWRAERNPQSIGSGVMIGKHIFKPNAGPGTVECLNPETNEVLWTERAVGSSWGSIVAAEDRLYVTNQDGTTFVFEPNPEKYVQIAENPLGEPSNSTPAISDGNLFIRTQRNLYCIGE